MSFGTEYSKFTTPSLEREAFVLKSVTSLSKSELTANMLPVSVTKPDGTIITYKVMPDYIKVDGMRVPMSGNTAQKVADYFGLCLPTAAIAQEIHNNANIKMSANPLINAGVEVNGKQYSHSAMVAGGVGRADFAEAYSKNVDKALSHKVDEEFQRSKGKLKGSPGIVSGFAKDVLAPIPGKPNNLGLYGFMDANGKAIQGGTGLTPHNPDVHTEYGAYVRLISCSATVVSPDGKTETKPLSELYKNNERYSEKPKAESKLESKTEKPKSSSDGRMAVLTRVDQNHDKAEKTLSRINDIFDKILG